jgi:hypothetical protein
MADTREQRRSDGRVDFRDRKQARIGRVLRGEQRGASRDLFDLRAGVAYLRGR